jgi:hypothetical protein
MDLQERLAQCQVDKSAIESKEQELLDQIKEVAVTYRVGDIFWRDNPAYDYGHYVRLVTDGHGLIGLRPTLCPSIWGTMGGWSGVHNINAITIDEVHEVDDNGGNLRFVEVFTVTEK